MDTTEAKRAPSKAQRRQLARRHLLAGKSFGEVAKLTGLARRTVSQISRELGLPERKAGRPKVHHARAERLIERAAHKLSAREIASRTGLSVDAVRRLRRRMLDEGRIEGIGNFAGARPHPGRAAAMRWLSQGVTPSVVAERLGVNVGTARHWRNSDQGLQRGQG